MAKLTRENASKMASQCQDLWDEASAAVERGEMGESDNLMVKAGVIELRLIYHGYNVHELLAEVKNEH